MSTNREVPKQFKNIFNSWEDYRKWCIEISKKELLKAFPKDKNK